MHRRNTSSITHTTRNTMTNTELTLDQLKGMNGSGLFSDFELLSPEEVADYWIEKALGDASKNLTKSKRRIDDNDDAGSDTGTTDVSDDCQPDWRRYA